MYASTTTQRRTAIWAALLLIGLLLVALPPRVEVQALAPAWQPNTSYNVGQLASYNGIDYKCLQAHTSQEGWEPPNTPALWEAQSSTTPTDTPTATSTTPTDTPTATSTPTQTPEPSSGTLLSQNKPAAASSIEAGGYEAARAVDGDAATRWSSAWSDPQWLRVDLGAEYTISRVSLSWETAYAQAYRIETSSDGSSWSTLYSTSSGDGGTDDLTVSGSGRYVRMYGTARGTQWGYSLWEFEIYGSGAGTPPPNDGTPVDANGQLHVCGTRLCNQYDTPIQLRGMSTHGLQWYGWGDCLTEASLDALAYDWQADILRISLYVQEGGYETDPEGFKAQVDRVVQEAVERGMYALLDWHMLNPGDPMYNLDRAREYFSYMAQKHGHKPNIIYEIANEPSGVSWSRIKSYAEQVIPVIRQYDPDGVVLVGTREWSSFGLSGDGGPEEVVNNPVNAGNIMYTFHFYAASHLDYHRNGLAWAADRLPVFVTEFGTQEYTGDGPNDFASAQQYMDLMNSKQISWVNWNYSDDSRTGAVFEPGTCSSGPWTGTGPLKEAGIWIRDKILNR